MDVRIAAAAVVLAVAIPGISLAQQKAVIKPGSQLAPAKAAPDDAVRYPVDTTRSYEIPRASERPFDPEAGDKIRVRRFLVDGVGEHPGDRITPEKVQAVADSTLAQMSGGAAEAQLTVGQLQRVAEAVTTYYRNNGFFVAQAFLPVQTVGPDAVVKLSVLEGTVAEVVVNGAKQYSAEVLGKPAQHLVGAVPLREDVESAVLYTKDYPGVQLFGTFRPGSQPGETQLVLQVTQEDPYAFAFGGDNYGTKFTGEFRARGDFIWNTPAGLGDRLALTVLQTAAPENTTFYAADYRVPVGPPGLELGASASRNAYRVTEGAFSSLQLDGTANTNEAGAGWRFLRSRFFNAQTGLSIARKVSQLQGGATSFADDGFNILVADIGFDRIDTRFKGVDTAALILRQALGGRYNVSGVSGELDPDFLIYELRYNRVQSLAETQVLVLNLRAQQASERVSSLEQFQMSGPDAVRAFPIGDFLRDSGRLASLEYRVQAPGFSKAAGPFGRSWGELFQLRIFSDYAYGEQGAAGSLGKGEEDLAGAGLGLQFGIPVKFQFVLQGAVALAGPEASDGEDFRAYGEFSLRF